MDIETLETQIILCKRCPRLVKWCEEVARVKRRAYHDWEYWGRPVPALGVSEARVLVVGLAPGAHGANRTGRMFTGDGSGSFLFSALHRAGFANQPTSDHRDDGLAVPDLFISAVCRCAPPDNKPAAQEIANCLPYLSAEIALLKNMQGVVALGRIAFENVLHVFDVKEKFQFIHGAVYEMGPGKPWLVASYHPSRQNTQTGRLTIEMFDAIWQKVKELLNN